MAYVQLFEFCTFQSNIETNKFTVDLYNGTEWYSLMLNGTVLWFSTIQVPLRHLTLNYPMILNGTERYLIVFNCIGWYTIGRFFTIKKSLRPNNIPLSSINGIGWYFRYSMVHRSFIVINQNTIET